ncbi:MAG: hypothetical protein OXG37_06195 [Actinomycetia bacterium]|nr:hypothetical protein [Actinomycetes bacterium]
MSGGRVSLRCRCARHDVARLPDRDELSRCEEKHPVAELRHEIHRVGDEDDGLSLALHPPEVPVAFLLERRIANR